MNKKIKIIEIFNIISKGDYEALPLNIKVNGNNYNWDTMEHFYAREGTREDLLALSTIYDTAIFLDMIAEVLEDNTEEIEEIKGWGLATDYKDFETINHTLDRFGNKINEIIRVYNKLRKEQE